MDERFSLKSRHIALYVSRLNQVMKQKVPLSFCLTGFAD
jgi:hypothetical protein